MTAAHAQHAHTTQDSRRLALAIGIAGATLVLELVGGVLTGSLALMADAGHVLSDGVALALARAAAWMATRPHSLRFTFGFHRVEILAASANALLLLLFSAYLAVHAVNCLLNPQPVAGVGLLLLAAIGLVANAVQLALLHEGASLNLAAARLHVWGDLGGSVAALLAGVVVVTTGWVRADSVLTLLILAVVTAGGVRMLVRSSSVLMAVTPAGIDLQAIREALRDVTGVRDMHDMHCWAVATDFVVFDAHVLIEDAADGVEVVAACAALLSARFGIQHAAIHPERRPLIQMSLVR